MYLDIPSTKPGLLSKSNLSLALRNISLLHKFEGLPETLCYFITNIERILELYPTQDKYQELIIFHAILARLGEKVVSVVAMARASTWPELKAALIGQFKNRIPYYRLLENLKNTKFEGDLYDFIESLKKKQFIIRNKLELENDTENTKMYNLLMDYIIKHLTASQLPNKLLLKLSMHDVSTVAKLTEAADREEVYGNYEPGRTINIRNDMPPPVRPKVAEKK